jgi:polyketide cyclase/dehydrase/lipid transport protein
VTAQAGPRDDSSGRLLTFDLSVAIRRPPAAVFKLLADVQEHEPIPKAAGVRMTKIPASPTAVGTRWHEQVRLVPGWWMSVDSVVTDLQEPGLLGMEFRSIWWTGHLTYTVEATPEGSMLRQRETLRPRWPLRWLAAWVDAGLRPRLLERLAEIRAILESAQP